MTDGRFLYVYLLAIFAFVVSACGDPDHRTDIVVYGDHIPGLDYAGNAFQNPYSAREDTDPAGDTLADPSTSAAITTVAGLKTPTGTLAWGVAAWAKYVFQGNYDEIGSGVFQSIADQRVGLFDSERKTFCQLDLDPANQANGSVEWLSVADPQARQTRIFFQGFGDPPASGFGYIEGDLDNPSPCDASNGWHVVRFLPADLNAAAAAAGQPDACPQGEPDSDPIGCGFDGMTVLRHDAAAGTDTIVLGNWLTSRIIIAKVNGNGELTVPAVRLLPLWQPTAGGACYTIRPVGAPSTDPTRPANDQRFLYGFDNDCSTEVDPPGCLAFPRLCPMTGATCTGSCAQPYCSKPNFFDNGKYVSPPTSGTCAGAPASCSNYPYADVCLDLGEATNACLSVHPSRRCSNAPSQVCANSANCPSSGTCGCNPQSPLGGPVQEYSFDGTSLESTSALFQNASGKLMVGLRGSYTDTGDVFLSSCNANFTGDWKIIRYAKNNGEHAFSTTGAKIVPEDQSLPFETQDRIFGAPVGALQVGTQLYTVGRASIQRDFLYDTWYQDTSFKVSLGYGAPSIPLPAESYTCSDSPTPTPCLRDEDCAGGTCAKKRCLDASRAPCTKNADCASGVVCGSGERVGEVPKANLTLGGAPPSIWTTPRYSPPAANDGNINAYLIRVPVALNLPGDRSTSVTPALAWSSLAGCTHDKCRRLWLIAAPGSGGLMYRTRDQGLWSAGWSPLPSNVLLTGGAAAVFNGSKIELFARAANDGKVYTSQLTSALDCSPGTCSWSSWQPVPGSPVTDTEPAAAFRTGTGPYLAVKDTAGKLRYAHRSSNGWSSWQLASGLTSDAAPSLVWKSDSKEVWLFARRSSGGSIRYSSIDGGTSESWRVVGSGGAVLPWATAPAAAFTGSRVRVLVGKAPFPNDTYQTTLTSSGEWDSWSKIYSGAGSTQPPALAVVNQDLNVVTTWYVNGMQEQLVK